MFRLGGATRLRGGREHFHARSWKGAARAADEGGLGRGACGGGTEARRDAAESAASASGTARGAVAGARHAARAGGDPLAAFDAGVLELAAVACGVAQGGVPRRPFLGPERSRPP